MGLRIFNTLTKKKEEFVPLEENRVRMYVCGVTVYDLCHIGHARSAIVFDVIYRYLKFIGYDVVFVKNFTDIDDKIINRANHEGTRCEEIAERYIREYYEDMDGLGLMRPTYEPRATQYIQEMIKIIERLIEKGFAYVVDGNVYFRVEKFSSYGKLSGKRLDELIAGARVEVEEGKENPLDFALWKMSKPDEPWWDSPWGKGRPGWHIECSAMGLTLLGETFDIHGGGMDLIFPHHENEIAQSEATTGRHFVRYWLHNGFVNIRKEKMSKSLGNIVTIKEILSIYHPEVVRSFILSSHYRSPIDYTPEAMEEHAKSLERFYSTMKVVNSLIEEQPEEEHCNSFTEEAREASEKLSMLVEKFRAAMDDDFNTAQAIGYIYDAVRSLNRWINASSFRLTDKVHAILRMGRENIRKVGNVLGLFILDPEVYLEDLKNRELKRRGLSREEIERLIEERMRARKARQFDKADRIREDLLNKGVILEDTPKGTIWRIKLTSEDKA